MKIYLLIIFILTNLIEILNKNQSINVLENTDNKLKKSSSRLEILTK